MNIIKNVLISCFIIIMLSSLAFADEANTVGELTNEQLKELYRWTNEESDGQKVYPTWATEYFEARPEGVTGSTLNIATGTNPISDSYSEEEAWEKRDQIHFDNAIEYDDNGDRLASNNGLVTWDCEDDAAVVWQSKIEGEPITVRVMDLETGEIIQGVGGESQLPYGQWGTCEIDMSSLKDGAYVLISQQGDLTPTYSFIDVDRTAPHFEIAVDGQTVANDTVYKVKLKPNESKTFNVTAKAVDEGGSGLWTMNNGKIDGSASGYYGMVVSSTENGVISADVTNVGDGRKGDGFVKEHVFSQNVTVKYESSTVYVSGSTQDRAGNQCEFCITFEVEKESGDKETGKAEKWANLSTNYSTVKYDTANPTGVIDSSIYDVKAGIPTNEYLNYSISTEKYLYNVGYNTYMLAAGVKNLTIVFSADYIGEWRTTSSERTNLTEVPNDRYIDDYTRITYQKVKEKVVENGKKVDKEYVYANYETNIHTYDKTYEKPVTYSITEGPYYSVPKSDFYDLKSGRIYDKHNFYNDFLNSGLMNYSDKVNNPGTRSIEISANKDKITLGDSLTVKFKGIYNNFTAAQSRVDKATEGDAHDAIGENLHKAFHVDTSEFSNPWTSPDGNNSLVITANNVSGKNWTPERVTMQSNKIIDRKNHNGVYNKNYGNATYENNKVFSVKANNVIVHTPVVNNSKVVPAKFKNQLFKQNANTTYLQLDADFEVFIPRNATSELCIDKKGYRVRPYNSYQGKAIGEEQNKRDNQTDNKTTWGKIKDVQIPFDTYFIKSDGNKTFVPSGEWLSDVIKDSSELLKHDSPIGGNNPGVTYKYTVPVWVEEKEYTIKTRVIAENADDNCISFEENGVNKSTDYYVATKDIPVEVIGKIYDLEVINYSDPNWKDIIGFTSNGAGLNRNNKEQTLGKITAEQFPAGTRTGIYKYNSGKLVYSGPANQNKDTLHNLAPKLGYTFTFSLKTKGRKSNNLDIKVANDGFRFVKKNPGKDSPAQVVDLYYKPAGSNMYVRIGDQANDKAELYAAINEGFFKSSELEKANSLRLYPAEKIAGSKYIPNSQPIVPYNYSQRVKFGRFYNLDIPHYFRLAFDNISEYATVGNNKGLYLKDEASIYSDADISKYAGEANKDFVTGSVGHWYIAYTLPVSTVAVLAGENPNSNPSKILKGGYIIVTFDIMSRYEDKDGNKSEYLIYTGPEVDFSSDCMEQEELHIEWNYVINSTGITSTRGGIGRKNNSSGNPKLSSNNSPINNPLKVGNDTLNKNVVTLAELQNLEKTNNAKELEQLGYYRQATMMDGTNTYIPLRSVAAYETDYTAAKDDAIVGGTH